MSKARKALLDLITYPWIDEIRDEAIEVLMELVERDEPMMYEVTKVDEDWVDNGEGELTHVQWEDCICKACGWKVDEESSIFCSVCGQRFREEFDEEIS